MSIDEIAEVADAEIRDHEAEAKTIESDWAWARIKYLPHMGETKSLWRCQGGKWQPVAKIVLERECNDEKRWKSLLKAIRLHGYLNPNFVPPFKFDGPGLHDETARPLPLPKFIRCRNGDVSAETGDVREHDPELVTSIVIPVEYDPDVQCPRIESFLELLVPDPDQRRFMLEYLGLCLVMEFNQFKRFLCIEGPKDCGKSVLIHIFQQLLGNEAFASLSAKRIGSQFGLSNAIGKLVNFSMEERWPTRGEESVIKAISGGDVVPTEFKLGDTVNFQPLIRMIFVSNDPVHFNDESIWDRVSIVACGKSIPYEQQDRKLREKLLQELQGFFTLLVRSVVRLYERGDFEEVPSMLQLRDLASRRSNHLKDFATEYFVADPESLIQNEHVMVAYKKFCEETGNKPTHDIRGIRRTIQSVFGLDGKRHRKNVRGGRQKEAIKGVAFCRDIWESPYESRENDPCPVVNKMLTELEAGR